MRQGCQRVPLYLSVVLSFILALAAPGRALAGLPMTIAVSRTPLSLLIFVAEDRGFFAKEGVEATLKDCVGGHRCLKLLLDGQADMATAADMAVVFKTFERMDFAIVATIATSSDDLKVISQKTITKPEQLVGKRVGMVIGTASQYFVDLFLLTTGVNPDTVKFVPLQPETAREAMRSGQVDAISLWEPFALQARGAVGGNLLSERGMYIENFNLVAAQKTIASRDVGVRAVLRAISRAQAFVEEHPDEARAIMRQRLLLDPAVIDQVWPSFSFRLSLEQSLLTTMEGEARWAVREAHVGNVQIPNFLRIVHTAPLRSVRSDAVRLPE